MAQKHSSDTAYKTQVAPAERIVKKTSGMTAGLRMKTISATCTPTETESYWKRVQSVIGLSRPHPHWSADSPNMWRALLGLIRSLPVVVETTFRNPRTNSRAMGPTTGPTTTWKTSRSSHLPTRC